MEDIENYNKMIALFMSSKEVIISEGEECDLTVKEKKRKKPKKTESQIFYIKK